MDGRVACLFWDLSECQASCKLCCDLKMTWTSSWLTLPYWIQTSPERLLYSLIALYLAPHHGLGIFFLHIFSKFSLINVQPRPRSTKRSVFRCSDKQTERYWICVFLFSPPNHIQMPIQGLIWKLLLQITRPFPTSIRYDARRISVRVPGWDSGPLKKFDQKKEEEEKEEQTENMLINIVSVCWERKKKENKNRIDYPIKKERKNRLTYKKERRK